MKSHTREQKTYIKYNFLFQSVDVSCAHNTLQSPCFLYFVFFSPLIGEPEKKSGTGADAEEAVPLQAAAAGVSAVSSAAGEQTTLVQNEEEAFALEPLDITTVPGMQKYREVFFWCVIIIIVL